MYKVYVSRWAFNSVYKCTTKKRAIAIAKKHRKLFTRYVRIRKTK